MDDFFQQTIVGLSNGAIYASLALALVLIFKGTGFLNIAQAEMAALGAYVGWSLLNAGLPLALVVLIVIVFSFAFGVGMRFIVLPVQSAGPLSVLMVTLGAFLALNSLTGWVWGFFVKSFPSPFSDTPIFLGDIAIRPHHLGTLGVTAGLLLIVYLYFQLTPVGLYMRASAENPLSSRLSGIPIGALASLGWGIAAVVGGIAGMLIAHVIFLTPGVMFGVLIWAVAAAILGGFDSPVGAVVGGLAVGVMESLSSFYIGFIGNDLKIVAAIALIALVLMFRPQGLFGKRVVVRV